MVVLWRLHRLIAAAEDESSEGDECREELGRLAEDFGPRDVDLAHSVSELYAEVFRRARGGGR